MEEFIETWGTKVLKAKPPFSALANVENLVKGSNAKKNIQNKQRQGHFINNPKKVFGTKSWVVTNLPPYLKSRPEISVAR